MMRARQIEKGAGVPFVRMWSKLAHRMIQDLGYIEELNHVDYFAGYGRPGQAVIPGFSPRLSEVYRSAYLETLRAIFEAGKIPREVFLTLSYQTLPIDLSFWTVLPSRVPAWWPKLGESKKGDLTTVSFSRTIENALWQDGAYVLALQGAAEPFKGWSNEQSTVSVDALAFGYKTLGPNLPPPRDLWIALAKTERIEPSIDASLPFHSLRSDMGSVDPQTQRVADLLCQPIVTQFETLSVNLWQWFRDMYSPFALPDEVASNAALVQRNDELAYVMDGKDVAWSLDWTEGICEKNADSEAPHHGSLLMADKPFMDEYLKREDLRLGFVLKTTIRYKKSEWDEKTERLDGYKLLNVSPIITSLHQASFCPDYASNVIEHNDHRA